MISEHTIQNALYRWLVLNYPNQWPIFPNCDTITGYEADMISISNAGYATEHEIKISLADYRKDRDKRNKHASLSGATRPTLDIQGKAIHVLTDAPKDRDWNNAYRCHPERRPKFFYYVVHGFLPTDLPAYAGLMVYLPHESERRAFHIHTPAPALKAQPVEQRYIDIAHRNALYRYWNFRHKAGNKQALQGDAEKAEGEI
jgi:hypothetical protein